MADYDLVEKFWSFVDVTPDHWLWNGSLTKGYGKFTYYEDGVRIQEQAHLFSHRVIEGSVYPDMEADHTCKVRHCVKWGPGHLEWATHSLNVLRSDHANRKKTHCANGHSFSDFGVVSRSGSRGCNECNRLSYHARKIGMTVKQYCELGLG